MDKKPAGALRERAERRAGKCEPELMPPERMRAALHELHVRQKELEMQNEELRRAQMETESARERYCSLYDTAPVGYCTLSDKGIIREANLTAAALFGAARSELIGKPFSGFVYKDDQDAYYLHKLRLFVKSEPRVFEIRLKRSGGVFFWADINASVLRDPDGQRVCRITMSDITGHKQAGERLLFQSNLLASVHDAIIAMDEDMNVSYWNGIAEDLTGWTAGEIIGQSAKNLFGRIVGNSPMEQIPQRFFRDGHYTGEVGARKKNGELFIADVHIKGITGPDGRRGGIVASFRDVTGRRRMEETLKESEQRALALVEQLQKADKSKNDFLGVLSHELRNPLATIMAAAALLGVTKDDQQTRRTKDIMERQGRQLCRLVDDLLDLTRICEGRIRLKKERIDLNRIAVNVVNDMQGQFAAKGVGIGAGLSPEPIYADADPVRITQAAGNLLFNALKFTNSGGRVWITVCREENSAVISVEDSGVGISPDVLPGLFESFSQVNDSLARSGGGLGLGLSITKGIVRLHGGEVTAQSAGPGKGAVFGIRLPVTITKGGKEPEMTKQAKHAARPLKILIVEDNRDFADTIHSMLTAVGYRVSTAYDGSEGLKQAKKFKPDAVFCDIGLPGMDGFEFAKTIRREKGLKDVNLIALTGYAGQHDMEHALESGFNTHLAKPVDLPALRQVLEKV